MYLDRKECLCPVINMSSSLSSIIRTGRPNFSAATAQIVETASVRVSFPPKPPPTRFTLQTTLFISTPSAPAATLCVSDGHWQDT